MGCNPVIFFWRVTFRDGTKLQQYDPISAEEVSFHDKVLPRIDEIMLFELVPFSQEFGKFLMSQGRAEVFTTFLPSYRIWLREGQRLIFFRRNFVHHHEYHKCNDCGHDFEWKDPFKLAICPNCGNQNYYGCEACGLLFEDLQEIIVIQGEQRSLACPRCGRGPIAEDLKENDEMPYLIYIENTKQLAIETMEGVFLLGFQETINGENYQTIMVIDRDGNVKTVTKKGKSGFWSDGSHE